MTQHAHHLVDNTLSHDVRNGLRLAGFPDLNAIHKDRPLTPDGHSLLVELWEQGKSIPDIQKVMALSEARCCAELLYLELDGRVKGFVALICEPKGDESK